MFYTKKATLYASHVQKCRFCIVIKFKAKDTNLNRFLCRQCFFFSSGLISPNFIRNKVITRKKNVFWSNINKSYQLTQIFFLISCFYAYRSLLLSTVHRNSFGVHKKWSTKDWDLLTGNEWVKAGVQSSIFAALAFFRELCNPEKIVGAFWWIVRLSIWLR